jgi:hypothetical protein
MTLPTRRGMTVVCIAAITGALALAAAWTATTRYERDLAADRAATVAAYLAVAAPSVRGSVDYDLPQLLIQARALATLLDVPAVEVYHSTAPLVHAVATPLDPAALERLRREATTIREGDAALAPLFDRAGWEVVGAVRMPGEPLVAGWVAWSLPVLLIVAVVLAVRCARAIGRPDPQSRALLLYGAAALIFGAAAYLEVRTAASGATDRWLDDTRAMVQEAATRFPGGLGLSDVTALVRGGELVSGENVAHRRTRGRVGGVMVGIAIVRMGSGRWAELRRPAAEAATGGWLLCTLGLALLGPVAAWITGRWGNPRRTS